MPDVIQTQAAQAVRIQQLEQQVRELQAELSAAVSQREALREECMHARGYVAHVYTAAQVRYMLEGAWCAGYYHADYTHDSAYAEKQAEKCADEFLGPNAEVTGLGRNRSNDEK